MTIVIRRCIGVGIVLAMVALRVGAAEVVFPDVSKNERFEFPRDHGAHADYRTEWWYVTGWLKTVGGEELGFQVTFFRSRVAVDDANPSRFAPRQLLFAHAALADAKLGRLLHDERIARTGFGIAEAATDDADVVLDGWRLARVASSGDGPSDALRFRTSVTSEHFALDLDLAARGPLLAQGADENHPGYSQKGPSPRDASRYYSVPQLAVTGTIVRDHRHIAVTGTAWLDREWSSAYLDPQAVGWDWVGLNLDDGGAVMAFRMRDRHGDKLWAGGTRRFPDGRVQRYQPDEVEFVSRRTWVSPRTKARWPVAQTLTLAGDQPSTFAVDPLMDDQELDSRLSTGTIYWEGAVRARGEDGRVSGKGYLELTGYFEPIHF